MHKIVLCQFLLYFSLSIPLTACFHESPPSGVVTEEEERQSEVDDSAANVEENTEEIEVSPFDEIVTLSSAYKAVKIEGVWGIAGSNEEIVISPQFDSIELNDDSLIAQHNGLTWKLHLDTSEKELISKFGLLQKLNNGQYLANTTNGWVRFDLSGKVYAQYQYESMLYLSDHDLIISTSILDTPVFVVSSDGSTKSKWTHSRSVLQPNGNIILDSIIGKVNPLTPDLFAIDNFVELGLVDSSGKAVLQSTLFELGQRGTIRQITPDLFAIELISLDDVHDISLVTRSGEKIFSGLDKLQKLSKKHFAVTKNGITSINTTEGETVAENLSWVGGPVDGYSFFNDGIQISLIGRDGNVVALGVDQVLISGLSENPKSPFPVKSGEAWGFMNVEGGGVVEPKYRRVRQFSEGLAAVESKEGLWGFVDTTGVEVIEPNFISSSIKHSQLRFRDGIVVMGTDVFRKNSFGLTRLSHDLFAVNKYGEKIFTNTYYRLWYWAEHNAFIVGNETFEDTNQLFIIDEHESVLFSLPQYPANVEIELADIGAEYLIIRKKDNSGFSTTSHYGLVGSSGIVLLEPIYTSISYSEDHNLFYVTNQDGAYGLVNMEGETILPFKYGPIAPLSDKYYIVSYQGTNVITSNVLKQTIVDNKGKQLRVGL